MVEAPNHVAIILDGNGRWAKAKGMPRTYGHKAGADNVEPICRAAYDMGIRYMTFYAFSTENWSRPDDEVSTLMNLLGDFLKKAKKTARDNNMRVRVIGDMSRLEDKLQKGIAELMEESAAYTGLTLTIALNYGSRDEIIRATNHMIEDAKSGKLTMPVTEEIFSGYLDTADLPDPDLLIRTSGEQRLSNYLLWQMAYTEFYFTEVPWPDFHEEELKKAVEAYMNRDRRYGGVKNV
ncbi:MAG: isoprenyl transferase [Lachnospiraceae bacterium]|nr:isoprenyl transferase [Lachnospiraceae bacterium]